MQESCTYGSVRGAPSNGRPYRNLEVLTVGIVPCRLRGAFHASLPKTKFAADSALEGAGFEPSVPRQERRRFEPASVPSRVGRCRRGGYGPGGDRRPDRAVEIADRRWCASEPPLESRIKPSRRVGPSRGTDGSNPSPSSGESGANRLSGAHPSLQVRAVASLRSAQRTNCISSGTEDDNASLRKSFAYNAKRWRRLHARELERVPFQMPVRSRAISACAISGGISQA